MNPTFPGDKTKDIRGTKDLFLVGPLTIIGDTISGYPSKSNLQDDGSLFTNETMGAKTPMEEEQRRRKRKRSALPRSQKNVFDPTKLCKAIQSRYQNDHC